MEENDSNSLSPCTEIGACIFVSFGVIFPFALFKFFIASGVLVFLPLSPRSCFLAVSFFYGSCMEVRMRLSCHKPEEK